MRSTSFLTIAGVLAAAIALPLPPAAAQGPDSTLRSSTAGVYSASQAQVGKDFYASKCTGCHTSASHTGEPFTGAWRGKTVADLMSYMREFMPKDNPGTLSPDESVQLIAYLLRLNGMPEGAEDLPADSTVLKGIRLDFAASSSATSHRNPGRRAVADLLRGGGK